MVVKVYYFNVRGLGEPIRIILSYGGEEFEDIRAPFTGIPSPLPPEIKSKCTWGQVPLVEFDGKKLGQSLAITRYFAKKFDLVPKDDFQAALCDEYVDACRDFSSSWMRAVLEKDESKRAEIMKEIYESTKERFLSTFNSIIEGSGGKHLVGDSLTWADIYLFHSVTGIPIVNDNLDDFPAIKSLVENVANTPKIKEWLKKRPVTVF
ncbi:unnamed protein product [Orchesella dallaii]|uniref:Glutathione S-transferase n=1 Tax=Orchesella dallaii TaxID=48710 RepID=A0ABP1R8M2_9HEXA